MAAAADTTEAEPATALPASAATATAGELTVGRKIDSPSTVYDFVVRDITGNPVDLEAYKGKVLLIFNGASKCGFTGQYGPLEELYQLYKDRGLVVLGFPCNQFGKQEPGDEETIQEFVTSKFGVTFPMMSKIAVNGAEQDPLFKFLQEAQTGFLGSILGSGFSWNFTKVLVNREGKPVGRYTSMQDPLGLKAAIEALL